MATTYTANAKLAQPSTNDRNWDGPLNANTAALDRMAAIGSFAVTPTEIPSTTLRVSIAAGTFVTSTGAYLIFVGQSGLTLAANATTMLYLTEGGSLQTGSAWPTGASYLRLATVTTGPTTVTTIIDARTPFRSAGASGFAPVASAYVVLAADPNLTSERVLVGTVGQVTVTDSGPGGNVTLGLPQSVATTATPTFTQVILAGNPTAPLQTATKQYVDAVSTNVNSRIARTGDTMTGVLGTAGLTFTVATYTGNVVIPPGISLARLDATNGAFNVSLNAPSNGNQVIILKKIDSSANAITISSTVPIDGQSTLVLSTSGMARTLVADAASNTWTVC